MASTQAHPLETPRFVPARAGDSAVATREIQRRLASAPSATTNGETSDEQLSDSAPSAARKRAAEKKRKPTYYMRKDEMAQLQAEMAELQKKMRRLESEPRHVARAYKCESMERNRALRSRVRNGGLAVATAQSLLASYGPEHCSVPLGDYIHLTKNPVERQRTLSALTMDKMHEAVKYVLARSQFLNVAKTTRQIDTFETGHGDFVTSHWEITPLEEAPSVRRAFDELVYFSETQEISMSEKLGVLTVRETASDQLSGAEQVRMLCLYENGMRAESNLAIFSHFFDRSELLDQPHGLVVLDHIDEDELFPFQPESRVRKDVASVTMVTECPSSTPGARPVVTMIRWAFVRVNKSDHTERRQLEYLAREGVAKWCDVMLKCVRDRLAWPGAHQQRRTQYA